MSDTIALRASPFSRVSLVLLPGIALVALGLAIWTQPDASWRLVVSALVGAAIGGTLLLSDFGFAGAFRRVVAHGDGSGFRAHALMLAISSALMLPMLAAGHLFGQTMHGETTAIGISFVVGALLFGAGMQLGGGCASGTLYGLGGGNLRLFGTVAGFVAGSALGAWNMGWWWSLPALPGATLQGLVGFGPALALQLAVLAAVALLASRGGVKPSPRLLAGGVALAVLNAATLLVAGKPWGETSAFALWGSQIAGHLGAQPQTWAYWLRPSFIHKLGQPLLTDITTIMDIAIVIGAAFAALHVGRFSLRTSHSPRAWVAAILGGIAMGYGARLANGCNIGAYFSAISMGNLSGWVWAVFALGGSWLGLKLRPAFGLDHRNLVPVCAPRQ